MISISDLIKDAFRNAHENRHNLENNHRSKLWVECLADKLRDVYKEESVVVFSRGCEDNKSQFRLNELLFDITVAEIEKIKSVTGKDITAITGAKWLIESEFKKTDSRDIIIDFSKLILGNSENKLLIISAESSLVKWASDVIPSLLKNDQSNFFLAFVPHPDDWDKDYSISIYQLVPTTRKWITL